MPSSAHNGESKEQDYGEKGEEEQGKEKESGEDNNYNNESSLFKIYLSTDKAWFVIVIVVVKLINWSNNDIHVFLWYCLFVILW